MCFVFFFHWIQNCYFSVFFCWTCKPWQNIHIYKLYKWLLNKIHTHTHSHVFGSMVDHQRLEFVFWRQLFLHEFPSIYLICFSFRYIPKNTNTHTVTVIHRHFSCVCLCVCVQCLEKLLKTFSTYGSVCFMVPNDLYVGRQICRW